MKLNTKVIIVAEINSWDSVEAHSDDPEYAYNKCLIKNKVKHLM